MNTYRVYFTDGNQQLCMADYEQEILDYMFEDLDYNKDDILKIVKIAGEIENEDGTFCGYIYEEVEV